MPSIILKLNREDQEIEYVDTVEVVVTKGDMSDPRNSNFDFHFQGEDTEGLEFTFTLTDKGKKSLLKFYEQA